ncbi:MAG: EVE domain-containing protein [Rhodothermaceae bacterium]|nr:EVE domain-containing protein [Rhodothermaceae bacterium]
MSQRRYWLMKSEPDAFSIDDLASQPDQTTHWEGVRNYQARNYMRDEMKIGDGVLFYHSNAKPLAVAGTARVVSESYPDPSQFDPDSDYFDEKATEKNPRWQLVDVKLVKKFDKPVLRDAIKNEPELADMLLIKKGSRLSIQPVTAAEWNKIHEMAGVDPE